MNESQKAIGIRCNANVITFVVLRAADSEIEFGGRYRFPFTFNHEGRRCSAAADEAKQRVILADTLNAGVITVTSGLRMRTSTLSRLRLEGAVLAGIQTHDGLAVHEVTLQQLKHNWVLAGKTCKEAMDILFRSMKSVADHDHRLVRDPFTLEAVLAGLWAVKQAGVRLPAWVSSG